MESTSKVQTTDKGACSPSFPKGHDSPPDSPRSPANNPTACVSNPRLPTVEANIDANILPGNAFAQMKAKKNGENSGPEKDGAKTAPAGPAASIKRPDMTRKASSLDYDEDLALPMPKPRHPKAEVMEASSPAVENTTPASRPHLLKKRATTDPIVTNESSSSEQTSPQETGDGKKKSRFELIKSKLSFKDLRKECAEDEAASRAPVPTPSDSAKYKLRRPTTSTSIPSPAPNSQALMPQLKPVEPSKSTTRAGVSNSLLSPATVAPSRIPLPPSGTFSHAQGTMAPVRAASVQRKNSPTTSSLAHAGSANKDEKEAIEAAPTETPVAIPRQPQIGASRPSSEHRLSRPRSPTSSMTWKIEHPKTGNTPPHLGDLLEGPGKLNYLPASWVNNRDTCPPSKRPPTPSLGEEAEAMNPIPSTYSSKQDSPVTSPADYLPSFQERLQKANTPLNRPNPPEVQNRSTATQVDEIVTIVRSIQRQTDVGINNIGKKLEDLSTWIGDQLKHQIEGISDLTRTKHELFAKQCEISREMMKFQLDVRLEIGVMERRFSMFEMKLLDELQGEIRALTLSYENLCEKTEALIAKHSSDENQKFIEHQQQKNAEIENEIAFLKAQRDRPKIILTSPEQHRQSESSSGSTDPLIKQPDTTAASLSPVTTTRSRMATAETKTGAALPRSISMSKKALLKSTREGSPGPPDLKDKAATRSGTSDEAKRWGVFGFRRRRDTSGSSTSSSKFPWSSSSRRAKEDSSAVQDDIHSSGSSTPPVPPIPRTITRAIDELGRSTNTALPSNIHPALRQSHQRQAAMREGKSPTSKKEENVSPQSGLVLSRSDQGKEKQAAVIGISGPLPTTSSDLATPRATRISPSGSAHSALREMSPSRPVPAQRSSDDLHRMPLLADPEWESPGWDRISSVHESRSAAEESTH